LSVFDICATAAAIMTSTNATTQAMRFMRSFLQ
jgi:hypothetical protein